MAIRIRLAKITDLAAINAIYNEAIADGNATGDTVPLSQQEHCSRLPFDNSEQTPVFVAELDGIVAGYNSLSLYRGGRGAFQYTRETSYYVGRACRRRGVGNALMNHVLAFSAQHHIGTLLTFVLSCNSASIALLHRHDFAEWGRFPGIANLNNTVCDHLVLGRHIS